MNNLLRKFAVSLCCMVTALLVGSPAWAIPTVGAMATLSFSPADSTINLGDPISIDVNIAGLEFTDLGSFDFIVNYDMSVLTFDGFSLGSGLGDIGAGDAWDVGSGNLGGGAIELAELSLLDDLSAQPASFTLATLLFSGAGVGISPLTFSEADLGDFWGDSLQVMLTEGSVQVNMPDANAPVPEPATMFLFGTGLAGMVGSSLRKKMKK